MMHHHVSPCTRSVAAHMLAACRLRYVQLYEGAQLHGCMWLGMWLRLKHQARGQCSQQFRQRPSVTVAHLLICHILKQPEVPGDPGRARERAELSSQSRADWEFLTPILLQLAESLASKPAATNMHSCIIICEASMRSAYRSSV